jgi:hypothetical protein
MWGRTGKMASALRQPLPQRHPGTTLWTGVGTHPVSVGTRQRAEGSAKPGDAELRERLPGRGTLAALERELASEIARSLGRAGSKLEAALQQAQHTLLAIEAALEPGER